ncbi:CBS domain-containing protein [Methanothermococcus okinawensis]|uniref:Signal transduction protein with CBS domains n=1 Tax=Methanothermococcus okinawensis (strain DSM 14208 / JCM 11175 / IH1) TaxID=647113 RepID=F8ANV3_METOI|nr:CBS domain-containing protein [Methanothermococcus okinawensis]AEH07094.1 putative signal transduction protein with CBS domains [Methanothermococcus okinawensis IH1]
MVNVESVMKKPIVVNQNNDVREVIKLFRKYKISGAPVIDDDRNLVGIISESDIIKTLTTHDDRFDIILPSPFDLIELPLKTTLKIEEFREDIEKALKTKVKDVMTKDVITVSPDTPINEAAEIMIKHKIKRLPVIKNGELVGIVTRGDLIEALV